METQDNAKIFFEKARICIKTRNYKEALRNLLLALEIRADYAEALSTLGFVHFKLGFIKMTKEQVFKLVQKALSLNKKTPITWKNMGDIYFIREEFDKAFDCYKKAIELDSSYALAIVGIGNVYYKKNDINKAIDCFRRGYELEQDNYNACNNLGFVYSEQKDFDKAIEWYEKSLELDPNNTNTITSIGNAYFGKKDYENALKWYEKALKLDPNDINALVNLGTAYSKKKDYMKAIEWYEKALKLDPNDINALVNISTVYIIQNKNDEAIRKCEKVLKLDPNEINSLVNLANIYTKKKEYEKALDYCENAFKINENNDNIIVSYGNVFTGKKEYDKAIKCYKKALEIEPNNIQSLINLSFVLNIKGDYVDAIKYLEKVLKLEPINTDALVNSIIAYGNNKDYSKAFDSYEKVLKLDPTNEKALVNMGNVYLLKQEFDKSIGLFEEVLKINPSNFNALNNLGSAYNFKKEYDIGIKWYQKALELEPHNTLLLVNLSSMYAIKEDFERAMDYSEKAIQIDQSFAPAWVNKGNVYFTKKLYSNSIECYKNVLKSNSNDYNSTYLIGNAYRNKKKYNQAIKWYEKALELEPKHVNARVNLAGIYFQKQDYDQAIVWYEKTLEVEPYHINAVVNMGSSYYNKKEYDKAIEWINKTLEIDPYNIYALINKGIVLNKIGKKDDVIEHYKIAIIENPNIGIFHEYLGLFYINNNDFNNALEEFKRAKEIYSKIKLKGSIEIRRVKSYEIIASIALNLYSELDIFDKKFIYCINQQNLLTLRNSLAEISNEFHTVIKKYELNKLPKAVQRLVYSKLISIRFLSNTMSFYDIDLNKIKMARLIFEKYKLSSLSECVMNLISLFHLLNDYESIEHIPRSGEEKILLLIRSIKDLNGVLTVEIFGKIQKKADIIKPPRIEGEINTKTITIYPLKNNYLRIGLVQIDYEVTEKIPRRLKNKESVKIKILEALKLAQEIQVDIICFPELCFSESFIDDVKPYEQMIIIGGSYYDNNYFNVCPIFIQGNLFRIQKINPASPHESEIFEGEGMKRGKEITIFQTEDKKFRFIILICKDFLNEGIKFITGKKKVDFIFVPSYNPAKNKFQQLADTFCNIYKVDSGISNISEKPIAKKSNYGGSSFFCFEHKDVINMIKSRYKMLDDTREFKILEAKGESMIVIDLFLKKVELSKTPESTPRIKIIGNYRFNQNIWIKQQEELTP